jgi:DNA uptake protein ComE-like DNA-binding protein
MLREWTPLGFVTRDFRNFPTPFQVESPAPTPRADAKATPAVAPAPAVTAPKPTAAKNAKASQKTAQPTPIVSVNTTPVDELAGVKGVSRPLAQAIVADRPYRSFTDLLRVKGMGPKLLAKLRPGFRL